MYKYFISALKQNFQVSVLQYFFTPYIFILQQNFCSLYVCFSSYLIRGLITEFFPLHRLLGGKDGNIYFCFLFRVCFVYMFSGVLCSNKKQNILRCKQFMGSYTDIFKNNHSILILLRTFESVNVAHTCRYPTLPSLVPRPPMMTG